MIKKIVNEIIKETVFYVIVFLCLCCLWHSSDNGTDTTMVFLNAFDNLDSQIGFLNRERHRMTQKQIYNHIKNAFFDDFFDNFIDHFFDHIFDNLGSQI